MFQGAPLPPDELQRLETLLSYGVMDTPAEQDFDDLVRLASQICEAPISLITLLDSERQWFKARVGLPVPQVPRDQAFCGYAIHHDEIMVVQDATQDDRFRENPLVLEDPQIRFYAGMPLITPEGHKLGTLCVIDRQPRELTEAQYFALRTLGRQVSAQLELRRKVKAYRDTLAEVERQRRRLEELNHLHDRLLSVMAHDLRSPLANLSGYLEILREDLTAAEADPSFLKTMHQQVLDSTELLDQMMHWASIRLLNEQYVLSEVNLAQLVEEEARRLANAMQLKGNTFANAVPSDLTIRVEAHAFRFVMRNLMLNANKFTQNGQINVRCEVGQRTCQVAVIDTGIGMSQVEAQRLLRHERSRSRRGTQGEPGFGLGLILCQDFVKDLGGRLEIDSQIDQGSKFSFTLPRKTAPAPQLESWASP